MNKNYIYYIISISLISLARSHSALLVLQITFENLFAGSSIFSYYPTFTSFCRCTTWLVYLIFSWTQKREGKMDLLSGFLASFVIDNSSCFKKYDGLSQFLLDFQKMFVAK